MVGMLILVLMTVQELRMVGMPTILVTIQSLQPIKGIIVESMLEVQCHLVSKHGRVHQILKLLSQIWGVQHVVKLAD